MICRTDEKESRDTCDNTAKNQRANDNFFAVDSDITRRVFAFADNGKFIAVFAETKINVHQNCNNRRDDDFKNKFVISD